ncbi:MAG: hypothetical protein ACLSC9_01580 [Barnesiella sp.]
MKKTLLFSIILFCFFCNAYSADIIKVVSPRYCSEIQGNTKIDILAPNFGQVMVHCWKQGTGLGTNSVVGTVKLDDKGTGSFVFPANEYPHGPITLRISGSSASNTDNCYLQLYNKSGVSWKEGLPATPSPAQGMTLVYADDFDSALSIGGDGSNATYYDHKPPRGEEDFSSIPFVDFNSSKNPFSQIDSYLRIRIDANKNSTGLISSIFSDKTGFSTMMPCYFECRFIGPNAPGTWPAFWLMSVKDDINNYHEPNDELDIIEAYGGEGKDSPNSGPLYSIAAHAWNQPGAPQQICDAFHASYFPTDMNKYGIPSTWYESPHIYGCKITETETIYYCDNIEVARHETLPISKTKPLYFMINLATGGGWPVDLSRYDNVADMYVDYVRVYSSNPRSIAVKEEVAVPANDFLNSIGANSAIYGRGENIDKTVECCKYTGIRWIRLDNADKPASIAEFYKKSGVKVACCLGSLNTKKNFNLPAFISNVKKVAQSQALLAIEGCNEPNNWDVKYKGKKGGANASWLPVAELHRDLYTAVKKDEILKDYPVWSTTETGAQTDNCGLQYLTIPAGANTLMPDGTQYADVACCHNYFVHPGFPPVQNNQTWVASDPTSACKVDGLYGNFGKTWIKNFTGYTEDELRSLPRVTTETGSTINGEVTEEMQALLYMSTYLAQYKRGWSHTAMYILRDRTDENPELTYGFYGPDYTPRLAADYLHNFTTILADNKSIDSPGSLSYGIADQPETVHDLLLQKSNGNFSLVIWGERFKEGADNIRVNFGEVLKKATIYNPVVGTKPVKVVSGISAINLNMTNHPYIIEIEK